MKPHQKDRLLVGAAGLWLVLLGVLAVAIESLMYEVYVIGGIFIGMWCAMRAVDKSDGRG